MDTGRCTDRRTGGALALGAVLAIVSGFVLALSAGPAWASVEATGSYAPNSADPGGYVVTLNNTGTEPITSYTVTTYPVDLEQIDPSPACKPGYGFGATIECQVTVEPGATTHLCYRGTNSYPSGAALAVFLNGSGEPATELSQTSPTTCPSSTGTSGSGGGSGSGSGGGSGSGNGSGNGNGSGSAPGTSGGGTHHWSARTCKRTYDAWSKKHRHATRSKKKAEAKSLHKAHGCSLSIWK